MEVSIFPQPEVRERKQRFIEARLHSDAEDLGHRERIAGLIETLAKSPAQPIYVVVDPATGAEVNRWKGAPIGQEAAFTQFLDEMSSELGVPGAPGARKAASH